jgi:hypothetical protein
MPDELLTRRSFAAAAFLLSAAAPTEAQTLPQHPRLLFNAEGIARLKTRIQSPDAAEQWKAFQARYDSRLKAALDLPPRGSNWAHWYVCPQHGARLTTGKQLEQWKWEHICPVGNERVPSDPTRPDRDFDGCVLAGRHDAYAREVQADGILYQITRDEKYAKRGRDILLAYADRYLSYPLHTTRGEAKIGGGRLSPQTLDESVWLIPTAQGADLLWDTLAEADRRTIADKLLLPAARDVILAHKLGVHNIQCWKNSAVGLTGLLLGDNALIQAAIDDPDRGYRVQMSKGVQPDGAWYEGAWGYHFYTLSAVWPLVEAARNSGIDLYGEPLHKMFQAPVQLAMPNLKLPAFNDSTEVDVHSPLYELAYARYKDPIFVPAIPSNRKNEYAVWFGVETLPADAVPALGSRNSPGSGYAILQRGNGEQATWLCLKYGPHGGGHGHPDKNNFILYSRGRVLFPDPGTRPYGSPLHGEWDRVTLAHNTLVVDEKSQRQATGKSLAFGADRGISYAMTDAGDIYEGVRYVRTAVMLTEDLVLFVDQVQADKTHTLDLAVHCTGRWTKSAGSEKPALPGKEGYQHLRDIAALTTAEPATLLLDTAALSLAGNEKTQIITATGIGKSTEDRIPIAIFRRNALQATYAWAAALDGRAVKLKVTTEAPGVVGVQVADKWKISVDRDKATVRIAQ